MDYNLRYALSMKSEFSSPALSPCGIPTRKRRRGDDREEIKAKIDQGLVTLKGCTGETDILQSVLEDNIKIAVFCSICSAIFSPNTGGHLKLHRAKCMKNIHMDRSNPHMINEGDKNEIERLLIDSMTKDAQSAAFFNSNSFISILQFVHELGFQYGKENALTTKNGNALGPANISTAIPNKETLEETLILSVNERKRKFYEFIQNNIQQKGGGFVINSIDETNIGFIFYFITDDWDFIQAPVVLKKLEDKNNFQEISNMINELLKSFKLLKNDVVIITNGDGIIFSSLTKDKPLISFTHWIDKCFKATLDPDKYKPGAMKLSVEVQKAIAEMNTMKEAFYKLLQYIENNNDLHDSLSFKFSSNFKWMSELYTAHYFLSYNNADLNLIRKHIKQENNPSTLMENLNYLCKSKKTMELIVKMFQPYLEAIQRLEENKSPTLHLVPGIMFNLKQNILKHKDSLNEIEIGLFENAETVLNWYSSITDDRCYFALILDPKRKNNMKNYLEKNIFLEIIKKFEDLVSKIDATNESSNSMYSEFNPYQSVDEVARSTYKTELSSYYATNVTIDGNNDEEEYDILQWWRDNATQFPRLAALARKFHSIPASSDAVDRIFNLTPIEKAGMNSEMLSNRVLY